MEKNQSFDLQLLFVFIIQMAISALPSSTAENDDGSGARVHRDIRNKNGYANNSSAGGPLQLSALGKPHYQVHFISQMSFPPRFPIWDCPPGFNMAPNWNSCYSYVIFNSIYLSEGFSLGLAVFR